MFGRRKPPVSGYQPKLNDSPKHASSKLPHNYGPSAKYVVHLLDKGQDFLRFVLTHEGFIMRAEPFQSWLWSGVHVLNMRPLLQFQHELNRGRRREDMQPFHLRINRPNIMTGSDESSIVYPVIKVDIL